MNQNVSAAFLLVCSTDEYGGHGDILLRSPIGGSIADLAPALDVPLCLLLSHPGLFLAND